MQSVVDLPPRLLLEELFYRVENVPKWNPTLVESYTIQVRANIN